MADTKKVEEGNAVGEKRKLEQPNSDDETFEQKPEIKDGESESSKRQKLEIPSENETEVDHSFLIGGEMGENGDSMDGAKNAEGGDEDENVSVEAEVVERRRRYTAEEKGKAVLIEESDEEEYDYYEDDSSSDDSDSDFSDGLDSESEDIPF